MPGAAFFRKSIIAVGLAIGAGDLLGQATVSPLGGEYSLVGSLPGDQVLPSLALRADGGVLAWQDSKADARGQGVEAVMMSSAGVMQGHMFRANRAVTSDQINPCVALLPDNNIIYVWESRISGTPDIYTRLSRPNKRSTDLGTNFFTVDLRANTYLHDGQINPAVTGLADGGAVLVWQSFGQDGSGYGIYARKLLANSHWATAREFLVNQNKAYNQRNPSITTLANGNYIIVWISESERSAASVDVYARVFSPTGLPVTDEILINDGNDVCSTPSVAALNDGGFTVVWNQRDSQTPDNGNDIWGRAFSAAGWAQGASFRINTYLHGDQYSAKIASGPSGSLVVWTSMAEDGSREGVFGRFLDGGITVSGDEFRVNTTTVSQQIHPTVVWNGVDRFVVAWTSFTGANGFDLFGQAYVLNNSH
ncbi:MAG TPA: hypothetical protein VHB20_19070 [Verrucomicrobiae bacterium]|nr:hypothetical protein [Verrucomicrobiae bacterium]